MDDIAVTANSGTPPSVTTGTATTTGATTGTVGGEITAGGTATITERGAYYSTTVGQVATTGGTKVAEGGTASGTFTTSLTGLTSNTLYYVAAYASSSAGTGRGSETSFTTLPAVMTGTVGTVTATSASAAGSITVAGTSANVTERGVYYSTTSGFTPPATGTKVVATTATGTGSFTSSLTNLTANTTYYVVAYATNAGGTNYGTQVPFTTPAATAPTVTTASPTVITSTGATVGGNVTNANGATVTENGVVYSTTNASPTLADTKVAISTGTGAFSTVLNTLTPGTLYYITAYATNSVGTAYGTPTSFTTLAIPTVTTNAVSNITTTTATGNGMVTATGGATVTSRGVVYSLTSGFAPASGTAVTGTTGTTFTASLTSLTAGTTYYVRAFATNSVGTGYGAEVAFTTTNTITTGDPIGTPVCATSGTATIQVPFTAAGTFTGAYTVQLSSATGSFTSPINLVTTGSASPLTAIIPSTAANGTGYKARVVNATPAITGSANTTAFTIVNSTVTISPSANQSILVGQSVSFSATETSALAATSREWLYGTTSGNYTTSTSNTTTTYTFTPATAGTYYVVLRSVFPTCGTVTSAATQVTVTIPPPVITVTGTLTAFNTLAGQPSTSQTINVGGSNLTTDIVVTAPTGYEVSVDGGTSYSTSVQTLGVAGTVASTAVLVRLTGATPTASLGTTLQIRSAGATNQDRTVSGTVVAEPTTAPAVATGTPGTTTVTLTLSGGNGTNYLVVVRPSASAAIPPVDGITYTANAAYGTTGTNTTTGTNNYVVLAATTATTTVSVTGLTASTAYAADVYAYNVGTIAGVENYFATAGTTSFTTATAPAILVTYSTTNFTTSSTSSFSTTTATNATSTNIVRGTVSTQNMTGIFGSGDFSTGSTLASAISGNDQVGFTITANTGYQANVSSIVLVARRTTAGPTTVELVYSTDNTFATYTSLGSVTVPAANTAFTFTPTAGTLQGVVGTLYFRLYGYNGGTGNLYLLDNGVNNALTVYGTVTSTVAGNIIVSNNGPLNAGSTVQNSPGTTVQSYTVEGNSLGTTPITVTAPAGFQVSTDNTFTGITTDANSFTLTQTAGTVPTTTVYVRLSGFGTPGTLSGNITNASGSANASVVVTGTLVGAPALTVSNISGALNTLAGTASAPSSYTLSGSYLTGDVTVTAPTGFEVAQGTSTSTYASTQTVTPSSGNVSTTIYVRLFGTTAGPFSGNVTNVGSGATTRNVAVSGTVVGKPTGTPTVTASTPTVTSVTLTLGAADGTNLLVVVRPASSAATAPTNQTTYTARTAYGTGTALGAGYVVFAAANATSVTVTGLASSTAYTADVYTYNVGTVNGFENYGAASGTTNFTTPMQLASAPGVLVLEENFDYPSGTILSTGTGGNWSRVGGTSTNLVDVDASSISFPQYGSSARIGRAVTLIEGEDVSRAFSAPAGTTEFFASALVRVNTSATDYFFSLAPSTSSSTYIGRIYTRSLGNGQYNFGAGYTNSTSYSNVVCTTGTTYLVVLRYIKNPGTADDQMELYVLDPANGVPLTLPIDKAVATAYNAGVNPSEYTPGAVALRQNSSTQAVIIDGIRVGTGWGAVVGRPVFTDAASTINAGNYYDLQVNNGNTVTTAGGEVNLENNLKLTSGNINTSTTNNLVLSQTATITGGSVTSFVNGPLSRITGSGAATTTFPIGKGTAYRPLTLNTTAQSEPRTYTAEQFNTSANTTAITGAGSGTTSAADALRRVSDVRYFTLAPTTPSGSFSGTVTLTFDTDDAVNNPGDASLVVAKRADSNSAWGNFGRSASTGTVNGSGPVAGTLTSDVFTSFSDFALASTDPVISNNPLPVTLIRFTASRATAGVQVAWATASEKNSDYFEVQRSLDGSTFTSVAKVAAHGTTTQSHTYTSLDGAAPAALLYYRLRQVDVDGTVAYSPVVSVAADGTVSEFTLAPNPARERISFLTALPTAYSVRNTLGQLVRSGTTVAGTNDLLVSELPAGVYFFELHGGAGRVVRKFVKE